MKAILTLVLLFISLNVFSQKKKDQIIGRYIGYFGTNIQLNTDSTFRFEWHFDTSASWTKGNWKVKNDTIFFNKIIVYDTLILKNNSVTLIVSSDMQPDKIYKDYALAQSLSSGGQDRYLYLKN